MSLRLPWSPAMWILVPAGLAFVGLTADGVRRVVQHRETSLVRLESALAEVLTLVPSDGSLGYLGSDDDAKPYFGAQYVLAPRLLRRDLSHRPRYLLVVAETEATLPEPSGYRRRQRLSEEFWLFERELGPEKGEAATASP